MAENLGMKRPGSTFFVPFNTFDSNDPSASVAIAAFVLADIHIFKEGGTTPRASDNGVILLDSDGIDFAGHVGIGGFSVDLADNSTAGFYVAGAKYFIVVGPTTVDAGVVNFVAATFEIGMPNAVWNTGIASLTSATQFILDKGPAEASVLIGSPVYIHDAASEVQFAYGVVKTYAVTTKEVVLEATPVGFTPTAADSVSFFMPTDLHSVGGTIQTALDINDILDDTNSLDETKIPDVISQAVLLAQAVQALRDTGIACMTAVIETVTDQTHFIIPATSDPTDDNALKDALAVFIDGTNPNQKSFRRIIEYTASSRTVQVASAPDFIITNADTIIALTAVVGDFYDDGTTRFDRSTDSLQEIRDNHPINFSAMGIEGDGHAHADLKEFLGIAPNALISGRVDASVGAMAAGVITAAAIAANAITAAKIASAAITAAKFGANAVDANALAADAVNEIRDAILDELTANHVSAGTVGQVFDNLPNDGALTFLDAAISSRATPAQVLSNAIQALKDSGVVLMRATIETVTNQTNFIIPATDDPTDNNALKDALAVFIDGTDPNQRSFRRIVEYTGASRNIEVASAPDFTITTADTIVVLTSSVMSFLDDGTTRFDRSTDSLQEIRDRTATATNVPDVVSLANIKTQVVNALITDTYAEPPQAAPGDTVSIEEKISIIYSLLINKIDVDGTLKEFYNAAGAIIWKKALADDGTNYNEGKGVSGP